MDLGGLMLRYYIPFYYWRITRLANGRRRMDFYAFYLIPQAVLCLTRGQYLALPAAFLAVACVFEIGFLQWDLFFDGELLPRDAGPAVRRACLPLVLWRIALAGGAVYLLSRLEHTFLTPFAAGLLLSGVVQSFAGAAKHRRWRIALETARSMALTALFPLLFLPDPFECILAFWLCVSLPQLLLAIAAGAPAGPLILAREHPHDFLTYYFLALEGAAFALSRFLPEFTAFLLPAASWNLLYLIGLSLWRAIQVNSQ